MRVRMTTAYDPVTSYKLAEELESIFSVQFGAIVTEKNNDVTVSIPFSEYWLNITRQLSSASDDDMPAIVARVEITRLPNKGQILQFKSRGWIRNAKDFEREVYAMLQATGDKVGAPELDKLIIKIKKTLSSVLSKFDSKAIVSEKVRTPPRAIHDEEE